MRSQLGAALLSGCVAIGAGPAKAASDVTWEQIAGLRITVALMQTRKVEIEDGVFTDRHQWRFTILPGAHGAIRYSRQDTGMWLDRPGKRQPSVSPVGSADTALEKVHPNPDGLGTAVWTFEPGRLTRLSVETVGTKGRLFVISFARNGDALTCEAKIDDVGEVGKSKTWVNPKGQKRRLVAILGQSTTCAVTK
jgi:hypothetical protein